MRYPRLNLLAGQDRRLRAGHPWVFSNELQMDAAAKALPPGQIVCLFTADGRPLALAQFNPHSLIAARVLTRTKDATIDQKFLERRLTRALRLREKLFDKPYYRLVHAEADGLPGLVIDRFGDLVVCQLNSAGMAQLEQPLLDALQSALAPRAVVLRNDSPVRELEGLERSRCASRGASWRDRSSWSRTSSRYLADPLGGQKTGWFYDQRDNRAFAARLARRRARARPLQLQRRLRHRGGRGRRQAGAGDRPLPGRARPRAGQRRAQRPVRAAERRAPGSLCRARWPGGGQAAVRPGDRRPARLRAQQARPQAGPARLSQAGARLRRPGGGIAAFW